MCKHAPGLTRLHPLLFRIEPIREVGEIFQGYYFGVHLAPFYRLGSRFHRDSSSGGTMELCSH